jgi:Plavaka transposase
MYECIEQAMEHGPSWSSESVTLDEAPNEPQILFYRNPHECVEFLFGNPTFCDSMQYKALEVFESDSITCVYNEMVMGLLWNEVQVSL